MSEYENFDPVDEINKIIEGADRPALPSVYVKKDKTNVVIEGTALVASANSKTLPSRRVGRFEMLEVLERSLNRTVTNFNNPSQRAFTAMRELSDFVNMATTGAQPKIAGEHRDLLPVGHPLSTRPNDFSEEELAQARAEWMSADPRIAEEFRPLVATAFVTPEESVEREYLIAKLEATNATQVPRDIILGLTAAGNPYAGGNSFLARSARARAQRRDRRGRFAWMGGGARVWLGKLFDAVSSLFRFAGYDAKTDSFDLEGVPGSPYFGKVISVPASQVEAIKAILPDSLGLPEPRSKSVAKNLIVDPSTLQLKDAPTGWEKVSSENGVDVFRSADGWIATRYPNLASAPKESSITRTRGANSDKSINPDLPVYHIAQGSADGTVVDKPFAVAQGWGDAQALIARYDKKLSPSKKKAELDEPQEQGFIKGWKKQERGYIPADYNPYGYYAGGRDVAMGNDSYTDPSGRFIAVSMAPKKQEQAKNVRKQVLESGKPIETFDGAKDWDGDVSNLWRLERVRSDGKREILGYYQDTEDIERDTEIPKDLEQGQDFYEEIIANTLQWGGNSVDFVDGSNPDQGYLVAHEADVVQPDGSVKKREQLVTPEDFMDPIEGPKILRAYALKNQEKLMEKGFYLGTWTDMVEVKDENGNVIDKKEMVFLDVSEWIKDFDDAFDAGEKRGEIAIFGASEGKSYYIEVEKRRRETIRNTPVLDKEEDKRVREESDRITDEENKWFRDNYAVWQNFERDTGIGFFKDDGSPNPEVAKVSPEIYEHLKRRDDAEKNRNSVFQNYIRSVFEMADGMDPGGKNNGLAVNQGLLDIRDRYVGDDEATLKMNAGLREGQVASSKVKSVDRLVNKSKLKQNTVLYRGAWLDPELVSQIEIQDSYFDRGFQSSGLDVDTATSYLDFRAEKSQGKERVVFRILAPQGMNAIHVGDDEVIMRRNTKMTIIRKTKLDDTTYIDVDIEPQTKEQIDVRLQGLVKGPRPESSESPGELLPDDGGGADGLGEGGPFEVNYAPLPTTRPDSERVTDPQLAIWLRLSKDVLGVSLNGIIDEAIAINQNNDPEKHLAKRLKANVAKSLAEKLKDVDDKEFVRVLDDLGVFSGLSKHMDWSEPKKLQEVIFYSLDARKEVGVNLRAEFANVLRWATTNNDFYREQKELVDKINSTKEVTLEEARLILDAYNENGRLGGFTLFKNLILPDSDNREFLDAVRYTAVSSLVSRWASTSNGSHVSSLAIQEVARRQFGIRGSAEWNNGIGMEIQVKDVADKNRNLIGRFLQAQYDLTQEYFKKKGISKITLYRGVKNFKAHDMPKTTSSTENGISGAVRLRPLSSWSTSEGVAIGFARGEDGRVFRKEFDVKNIFSMPGFGNGCYEEKEMVVLGGVVDSVDIGTYSVLNTRGEGSPVKYPSPEPQAITYESLPNLLPDLGLEVNYAPSRRDSRLLNDAERNEIARHHPTEAIWVSIAEDSTFHKREMPLTLKNSLEFHDREAIRTGQIGTGPMGEGTVELARALKKGVAQNLENKMSSVEASEWAETANLFKDLGIVVNFPNDEESSQYGVVRALISSWAFTSNGDEPLSLAIQELAKKEFGIEKAADWEISPEKQVKVDKILETSENLIRKFLRAQYDLTQEYFKRKGIKKLTLFRGVKKFSNHEIVESTFPNGGKFTATLGLRPLSAWTTSRRIGTIFANRYEQSRLFRKEFDVKDIFCFPGTGFGCLDEREFVVLGGNTKGIDVSSQRDMSPLGGISDAFNFENRAANYQVVFDSDVESPLDQIAESGFRLGEWVNYAPERLIRPERDAVADITSFDPTDEIPNSPKNAGGMTENTWWAWERGPDGNQFIDYMRQQACRLIGLPVPETEFDKGKGSHFMLQRGWGAPGEKAIKGMVNAIANSRPQPPLYRGLANGYGENASTPELERLRSVREGDTVDMPLASATRSPGVATWYATNRGTDRGPIILKIREGANGVSLSKTNSFYPHDYETVVNGKFRVVGNQTVLTPVWSRDYVNIFDTEDRPAEGIPILRGQVPEDLLNEIREALIKNPKDDLSRFNTDTLKFTNDRNRSKYSIPISVWMLSEPKEIQVIELEQEKVYSIDENKPESKNDQPETYENVEPFFAEKLEANAEKAPLDSPAEGFIVSYAPLNLTGPQKLVSSDVPEPKKYGKDLKKREQLFKKYEEAENKLDRARKEILDKERAARRANGGAYRPLPYKYDMDENGRLVPNPRLIDELGRKYFNLVQDLADSINALRDFDKKFIESKFELSVGGVIPNPPSRTEITSPGDIWQGLKNVRKESLYAIGDWGASETSRQVLASTRGSYVYNKSMKPEFVSRISPLISQSTLKENTQLHRGEWLPENIVDAAEVGDSIYFDNIQELSLLSDVPNKQLLRRNGDQLDKTYYFNKGKKPVVLRLNCPKGMNALYTKNQADESENFSDIDAGRDREDAMVQAVLLRPDVKMKLVSKTEKDGVTYLEFDVEPKTKEEIESNKSGLIKKDGQVVEQIMPQPEDLGALETPEGFILGNDAPIEPDNRLVVNYAPKNKNKGAGLAKEVERRQKLAEAQKKIQGELKEKQEKEKEILKERMEEQKEELAQKIPEIAQMLPSSPQDLLDPNQPLNILGSTDITQEIFNVPGGDDPEKPNSIQILEPNQVWKDLVSTMEALGSAASDDIENQVNEKFAETIKDLNAQKKQVKASRDEAELGLRTLERAAQQLENSAILNNFGANNSPVRQSIIDTALSYINDKYFLKDPNAPDLVWNSDFGAFAQWAVKKRYPNISKDEALTKTLALLTAANSHLIEIAKMPDSAQRDAEVKKVIAKMMLGTYFTQTWESFFDAAHNLNVTNNPNSAAWEAELSEIIGNNPIPDYNQLARNLFNKLEIYEDNKKNYKKAITDFSKKVHDEIIKPKLEELGIVFGHSVTIEPREINYVGKGSLGHDANRNPVFVPNPSIRATGDLTDARGYASILTEAIQTLPYPIALLVKNFIASNDVIFFATDRGNFSYLPKDRSTYSLSGNLSPQDAFMSLGLDGPDEDDSSGRPIPGSGRKRAVSVAAHELTHMMIQALFPELKPAEWAVLARFITQRDANGNLIQNLVNGNLGDTVLSSEITNLTPASLLALLSNEEVSVFAPEISTPYSTQHQKGSKKVGGVRGLNPFLHGEFFSTLTQAMFSGDPTIMYPGNLVSPGDKLRVGFNADGTPKYFTIPDGPIFNAGALPVGIVLSLLMNELAKQKQGIP